MKIFVEADSIAVDRMSGIGHATLEIIKSLSEQIKASKNQLVLIVPYGKKASLKKYGLDKSISVRTLPPGYKYVNYLLVRTSFPFPVDLMYGRGVYIFTNYKNWYVPFSRSLTFVHDIAYKVLPDTIHPKNLVYLKANMRRWMKRTDTIIAISQSSKLEIAEFFPEYKDKLELIYLGIDKRVFYKRTPVEIEKIKNIYGLGEKYFLYVGNIEPRKNIGNLISAYKIYSDKEESPQQLVIVGGGGWRNESTQETITQMKKNGYNIITPKEYVQDGDLPMLYSGATALVHLSLHEGFGLSLVQAQASGTKIIASDLAVFRETLDLEGVTFVNEKDTQDIAKALKIAGHSTADITKSSKVNNFKTWHDTAVKLLILAGIINT